MNFTRACENTTCMTRASCGHHGASYHLKLHCLFNDLFVLTQTALISRLLLALCERNPWPVDSLHKGSVMPEAVPNHDVIIGIHCTSSMTAILSTCSNNDISCVTRITMEPLISPRIHLERKSTSGFIKHYEQNKSRSCAEYTIKYYAINSLAPGRS